MKSMRQCQAQVKWMNIRLHELPPGRPAKIIHQSYLHLPSSNQDQSLHQSTLQEQRRLRYLYLHPV